MQSTKIYTSAHIRYRVLSILAEHFNKLDIFYVLSSGTLLGAIRESALIEHDHDFDIEVYSRDIQKIIDMNDYLARFNINLIQTYLPSAIDVKSFDRVEGNFDRQRIAVYLDDLLVGDIFCFTCFSDGMLRRVDINNRYYFNARHQTPVWYWLELDKARLYGEYFPVPRYSHLLLESMYGSNWVRPIKPGEHAQGHHPTGGAIIKRDMNCIRRFASQQGGDRFSVNSIAWPFNILYVNSKRSLNFILRNEPELFDIDAFNEAESNLLEGDFSFDSWQFRLKNYRVQSCQASYDNLIKLSKHENLRLKAEIKNLKKSLMLANNRFRVSNFIIRVLRRFKIYILRVRYLITSRHLG